MLTGYFQRCMRSVSPKTLFFLLIFGFLFACEGKKMDDPAGALKIQAEAYWKKRLLEKDYKATYEMEAEKDRLPYAEYEKRIKNAGQLAYLRITVEKVTLSGNEGEVKAKVKLNFPQFPKPVEMALPKDQWVIEKNQWKHVLIDKKNVMTKN